MTAKPQNRIKIFNINAQNNVCKLLCTYSTGYGETLPAKIVGIDPSFSFNLLLPSNSFPFRNCSIQFASKCKLHMNCFSFSSFTPICLHHSSSYVWILYHTLRIKHFYFPLSKHNYCTYGWYLEYTDFYFIPQWLSYASSFIEFTFLDTTWLHFSY